jgi:hypothetical protein
MVNVLVAGMIGLTIAIILGVNVVMPTIKTACQSGWTGSETSLWNSAMGISVIVGLVVTAFISFGLA